MAQVPDVVVNIEVTINDRDAIVQRCLTHLHSLHTTLWMDWILEEDKTMPDGTTQARGYTKAANWLADTIIRVFDLTPPEKCAQTEVPPNQPKGEL
jgi:hypothetical protein